MPEITGFPTARNSKENAKFAPTQDGDVAVRVKPFSGLVDDVQYDFIDLSYTANDLTGVVFKQGGSGGVTVATLTLTYSAGNLDTVTRT